MRASIIFICVDTETRSLRGCNVVLCTDEYTYNSNVHHVLHICARREILHGSLSLSLSVSLCVCVFASLFLWRQIRFAESGGSYDNWRVSTEEQQDFYFGDDAFHKAEAEDRAMGSNAFQRHKQMMDDSSEENFGYMDHEDRTDRGSTVDDEDEDDAVYEDIDELEVFGVDLTWLVQLRYTLQEKLEDAVDEAYELVLDAIHFVKVMIAYYWEIRSSEDKYVDMGRAKFRGGDTGIKRRTLWQICKQRMIRRPERWRRKAKPVSFFEYQWRF